MPAGPKYDTKAAGWLCGVRRLKAWLQGLRLRLAAIAGLVLLPPIAVIILWSIRDIHLKERDAMQDALRAAEAIAVENRGLIADGAQLLAALAITPPMQSGEPAECAAYLRQTARLAQGYTLFAAFRPDGSHYCASRPDIADMKAADIPVFQRTLARHSFGVGDFSIERVTGKPVLMFAQPVTGPDGSLRLVLMAGRDLSWLDEHFRHVSLPQQWSITVVDRNGTILIRYPQSQAYLVGKKIFSAGLQALARSPSGVFEGPGLDGVPRFLGYTPLGDEATGLTVFVGIPRQVVLAVPRRMVLLSVLLVVAVLAAGIMLVWLVGGRIILSPVSRMMAATAAVSAGDLSARAGPPYQPGELGILARSFDEMAGRLDANDRQLRDAKEMLEAALAEAERANDAKSRFLAAASHDLRQPLQALRLLLDLLVDRQTDPSSRKIGENALAALAAGENLLNALLDVSILESGRLKPDIVHFPAPRLIERLAEELGPQAVAKGLRFKSMPCSAVIVSDPVLLERMIRNLLHNALRYTRQGGILIGCRRRGALLEIGVWDTGIGIPADQLEEIFEDFRQLENPQQDQAKGLGLGLSVVKRMAGLLGHGVTVRSQPGKGSAFLVSVPLAQEGEGKTSTASGLPSPSPVPG